MIAVLKYFTNKLLPYDVGLRVHQKRVVQALADIFILTHLSVVFTRLKTSLSFGLTTLPSAPRHWALRVGQTSRSNARHRALCVGQTSRSITRHRALCVGQTSRSNTRHRALCVGQTSRSNTRHRALCVGRQGPTRDTGHCVLDRTSRHWALCVGQEVKTPGPVCWRGRQGPSADYQLATSASRLPRDCFSDSRNLGNTMPVYRTRERVAPASRVMSLSYETDCSLNGARAPKTRRWSVG